MKKMVNTLQIVKKQQKNKLQRGNSKGKSMTWERNRFTI